MARDVIFLRGVNVGGHGKFAMADFKRLLEGVGATAVTTFLNSGNAAFTAPESAEATARALQTAIEAEYGAPISVSPAPPRSFARSLRRIRSRRDR